MFDLLRQDLGAQGFGLPFSKVGIRKGKRVVQLVVEKEGGIPFQPEEIELVHSLITLHFPSGRLSIPSFGSPTTIAYEGPVR